MLRCCWWQVVVHSIVGGAPLRDDGSQAGGRQRALSVDPNGRLLLSVDARGESMLRPP
eukprot:COSAG01_NODE_5226_length_4401_cov_5.008601_4_plen_58_part_00